VTQRASVRAGDAARVQMWLRVDRTGDAMGFFDNMDDRPVVGGGWQDVEIRGLVADDAHRIAFGFLLITGDSCGSTTCSSPSPRPARATRRCRQHH
jgi:hypothetical protein